MFSTLSSRNAYAYYGSEKLRKFHTVKHSLFIIKRKAHNFCTVFDLIQISNLRGGKGKKTLMQNKQQIVQNILRYKTGQHRTKSTASFAKTTDAKQTITNAKPTVMHWWINTRRRAKKFQEKLYPGENVSWRKRNFEFTGTFSCADPEFFWGEPWRKGGSPKDI